MLRKLNTKKKTLCLIAIIIVLCGLIGLMVALKNVGNVPANQFKNGQLSSTLEVQDLPLLQGGVDQDEPENESEGVKNNIAQERCSAQCRSTLSILDKNIDVDDEAFRKLKRSAKAVASFLQKNRDQRQHYLTMALTTTDDDKRRFLTDIFNYLPTEQKQELGESLINSEGWHARAQGVTLITGDGVSDLNTAKTLTDTLSVEQNAYVKGTILRHLKHSDILKGDSNVLNQLDLILNNASDEASTRVEALKAKLELSEEPYLIIPDAVQALHTSESELQLTGLMMIDKILQQEDKYVEGGVYIDKKSIKDVIQSIRETPLEGEEGRGLEGLIQEADAMYLRYFES